MTHESHFVDADSWVAAVDHVVGHPAARPILDETGMEPGTLLAVARVEAVRADAGGIALLSHEQLAECTGLPRATVLRARLALIELGLEHLATAPGAPGTVRRLLCLHCATA
ncbi:hypothetical protein [Leifsonia aquatica]|uniref:hypothetical protein n=1 Tax=Leifsonia aquatica TaxID=144185 RepID=UPI00381446DD